MLYTMPHFICVLSVFSASKEQLLYSHFYRQSYTWYAHQHTQQHWSILYSSLFSN